MGGESEVLGQKPKLLKRGKLTNFELYIEKFGLYNLKTTKREFSYMTGTNDIFRGEEGRREKINPKIKKLLFSESTDQRDSPQSLHLISENCYSPICFCSFPHAEKYTHFRLFVE